MQCPGGEWAGGKLVVQGKTQGLNALGKGGGRCHDTVK